MGAVASELEGRGPARRLAGLLEPERVGYGQVAASLGRAGGGSRRKEAASSGRRSESGMSCGWKVERVIGLNGQRGAKKTKKTVRDGSDGGDVRLGGNGRLAGETLTSQSQRVVYPRDFWVAVPHRQGRGGGGGHGWGRRRRRITAHH